MKSQHAVIAVTAFVTGFWLTQHFATYRRVNVLTKGDDVNVAAVETAELFKNLEKLEVEKQNLQGQRSKLQTSNQESQAVIADDVARLRILAGEGSAVGEGIEIRFEKPLVAQELTDLTNALRNIGAEAIAVNDRRITMATGFSLNDGQAPLTIKAIGKKQLLKEAVARRGGILEQIGHGNVAEHDALTLPAAR